MRSLSRIMQKLEKRVNPTDVNISMVIYLTTEESLKDGLFADRDERYAYLIWRYRKEQKLRTIDPSTYDLRHFNTHNIREKIAEFRKEPMRYAKDEALKSTNQFVLLMTQGENDDTILH